MIAFLVGQPKGYCSYTKKYKHELTGSVPSVCNAKPFRRLNPCRFLRDGCKKVAIYATTLSSANFSNVDPYGNHLSLLETAQWFQSVAQVEPALLNFDETLALSTDSETFSLYPCLNLGRSTCNDSLISNSNYSSKYANTKEIIVGDKSKGKFPWSAWFKVEDTTAVNKEETKVEKKGRYVFVIVTLLVIACVVPMIQYFSYTRDK
ncbi:hypothetical protein Gasu2_31010 [Galdieria sulphuraria]|nr:hypothetical protein Gasu2_31010 [Galdieria sulphuraria]